MSADGAVAHGWEAQTRLTFENLGRAGLFRDDSVEVEGVAALALEPKPSEGC